MRKSIKTAVGLLAAVLFAGAVPVKAAENPDIYLQSSYVKDSENEIQTDCMVKNSDVVTNGKVRILYDSDKVKLLSAEAGEGLGNAMCEINDCLKGNKKEGELVAAFASSGNIEKEGAILNMKFQIKDGIETGDKITFTLKPEKLAGENGDFDVKESKLEFEVDKKEIQTSVPQDNQSDKGEDKDKDKNPDKDKDSGKGSTGKTNKVRTGDEAEVGKYAALGAGTGLIILVYIVMAAKKKKKNQ